LLKDPLLRQNRRIKMTANIQRDKVG